MQVLFFLLLSATLQSRGQGCQSNYYFDESAGRCCWQCADGEGIHQRCTNTSDTICIQCPEVTFSAITPTGRSCEPCTVCSPARTTITPCSSTQNTECGSCSAGWFMLVSSTSKNQCLKCSPCPPGEVVIHWSECKEVGLPEKYQCMPGEPAREHATERGLYRASVNEIKITRL